MPNVLSFYQRHYNNVAEVDAFKSKWYVEDRSLKEVQANLEAR